MNSIIHSNIFEKIAFDIDCSPEEIKDKLHENGVEQFIADFRAQEPMLYTLMHRVSAQLLDNKDRVLLNNEMNLADKLKMILERYYDDRLFKTNDISIAADDELLNVYRCKINSRIMLHIQDSLIHSEKLSHLYSEYLDKTSDIFEMLEMFIANITSEISGINMLIRYISNLQQHKELFDSTVESSFLSIMFGVPYFKKTFDESEFQMSISTLICACFFQSSFELSENDQKTIANTEPLNSVDNTKKLCKCELASKTVEKMLEHRSGKISPLFFDSDNTSNKYLEIIVTVNLFLGVIKRNDYLPNQIEAHKAMYYLAECGYVSREIVLLLGEALLPKLKCRILSYADAIKDSCKGSPFIWGISGDMMPIKFLCDRENCQHTSNHKTLIPSRVVVNGDFDYDTNISRGIYYTCDFLTNKLRNHYKQILKE